MGRAILAAGPSLAITCEMIAVYPETADPQRQGGEASGLPGGQCMYFPSIRWRVIYARDCYPTVDVEKRSLPDADAVTEWTKIYVDRCESLQGALLDLSLAQGCGRITVEPGTFQGPSTGVAYVSVPVLVGPGV